MPNSDETSIMKVKDLFEADNLLTGRTEIENVSKLNTGLIWSCSGTAFNALAPDVDNVVHILDTGNFRADGAITDSAVQASVNLPHGSTVTEITVYGSDTGNTWKLVRRSITQSSGTSTMGTAAINTSDTTITDSLIENSSYGYFLQVDGVGSTDQIYGAIIKYTI